MTFEQLYDTQNIGERKMSKFCRERAFYTKLVYVYCKSKYKFLASERGAPSSVALLDTALSVLLQSRRDVSELLFK